MGALEDSSLTARKLAEVERVLRASPAYLARAGAITDLRELGRCEALTSTIGNRWVFRNGESLATISLRTRFASNQIEVCTRRRWLDATWRCCRGSSFMTTLWRVGL